MKALLPLTLEKKQSSQSVNLLSPDRRAGLRNALARRAAAREPQVGALPEEWESRSSACNKAPLAPPAPEASLRAAREGEARSLQSHKSGGFLRRGKTKRVGVWDLLPAAALSPVRRWSHSLDPTRISGKQKSCCSPSPALRRVMDLEGLKISSVSAERPRDCSAPSLTHFCCGIHGVTGRKACGSTLPAPQTQTGPVAATGLSCWG